MKKLLYVVVCIAFIACSGKHEENLPPPNILWVTVEDMSPMLGVYGDAQATTPELDDFAKRSIRYTNAFAVAPVCASSRSCIITGFYGTSLGTQHTRSVVAIPSSIKPYPKYLREAGYYTTNNVKEDYNFIDNTIWDHSSNTAHWRGRKKDQPFFSVFNLMLTHQSSIFGNDSVYEERISRFLHHITPTSSGQLVLPPYYPVTPETRKLWARYYTNVSIIDYQFKKILEELEEDGLTENTVVFFYSDHGTGVPRHKRSLYDSGMKIPFMLHVPEKYAARFGFKPGVTDDNMISFVDLAPTLFELAGIPVPDGYPGKPIISSGGGQVNRTPHVYGAADRVDEAYDLARSIRTEKYLYIRNFLPHIPWIQPNFYSDNSEIMKELSRLRHHDGLTPAQKAMFAPQRTTEELYEVAEDPHQINNLANDSGYQEVLLELRGTLKEEIMKNFDTGFAPEPELIRLSNATTPFAFVRDTGEYPLEKILEVCDLLLDPRTNLHDLTPYMDHENGLVRYWSLIAARRLKVEDAALKQRIYSLLRDEMPTVQVEAAKLLVELGDTRAAEVIVRHMQSDDKTLVLFACRTFQEISNLMDVIPDETKEVYEKLRKETNGGDFASSDFYEVVSYWALTYVFDQGSQ